MLGRHGLVKVRTSAVGSDSETLLAWDEMRRSAVRAVCGCMVFKLWVWCAEMALVLAYLSVDFHEESLSLSQNITLQDSGITCMIGTWRNEKRQKRIDRDEAGCRCLQTVSRITYKSGYPNDHGHEFTVS